MTGSADVKIYIAQALPLEDPAVFAQAVKQIDAGRRSRLEQIRNTQAAKLCVGAGLLLRYALQQAGVPYNAQIFAYGSRGKPYLARQQTPCFNLSHSGSRLMCVTAQRQVGCDLQLITRIDPRIAKRYYHPQEQAFLSRIEDPEEYNLWMNRIWSRKESVVKAEGSGLVRTLAAFSVLNDRVYLPAEGNAPETEWYVSDVPMRGDFAGAVCLAQGNAADVTVHSEDVAQVDLKKLIELFI